MNNSLKVLSIVLLATAGLRAEETASPVETVKTKAVESKKEHSLKNKIRSAVVSILGEQSEISLTDDQLTTMVASFEKEIVEKSVKEQEEWLKNLNTISLTCSKEKTA